MPSNKARPALPPRKCTLPLISSRKSLTTQLFVLSVLSLSHGATFGQAPSPATLTPTTPVAIENTNAAFTPTDVNVPQANAARPTVTIPAHVLPTGYLQFEQGFTRANESPAGTAGQAAISQTKKIALTTRLMLHFVSQPYAYSTVVAPGQPTVHSTDPGDPQVASME